MTGASKLTFVKGEALASRRLTLRQNQEQRSSPNLDHQVPVFSLYPTVGLRGIPSFIRSDNGPEFVAQAVQDWIKAVGARTAYIEPGSPWENG